MSLFALISAFRRSGKLVCPSKGDPGTFNIDMAISRSFPIREQKRIEFRFEAFNAINHFNPSIGVPGTTAGINSSNFGRQSGATTPGFVPSAFDPRILQLGLKVHW
jgi:hypothetical protein